MTEDDREFRLALRVYIEDTDAGGIVYYVNYLKFLERARTEFMRDLGFGKDVIFNHRMIFVVRSMEVDYRAPALLDDELEVGARLEKIGGASLVFAQGVRRGNQDLVTARLRIACVDRDSMGPCAMPTSMRERLGVMLPETETSR